MKKIYLPLFFIFIIASIVGATSFDPIKRGEGTDFRISCFDINWSLCNQATTCQMTVSYPNNSLMLDNASLTNNGTTYNRTIQAGLFIDNGEYPTIVTCQGTSSGASIFRLLVTQTGYAQSTAQGLGGLAFLIIIAGLTFLFGWMGFKLVETKGLWVLGIFMFFLSLLFVIYDVWLSYEYRINYTGSGEGAVPEVLFYIFLFAFLAGVLVSLALLFTRWRELARYIKDQINRKKDERDEMDDLWEYDGWGKK